MPGDLEQEEPDRLEFRGNRVRIAHPKDRKLESLHERGAASAMGAWRKPDIKNDGLGASCAEAVGGWSFADYEPRMNATLAGSFRFP